MAEDGWAIQVNYKIGNDLINVRAQDGMDLQSLLVELGEAAGAITETGKLLGAVQTVGTVLGGQQVPAGQYAAGPPPGPGQDPSGPPAEYCPHGQMTFRSGTSGKGNPYALHECPVKDANCQTRWAKRR